MANSYRQHDVSKEAASIRGGMSVSISSRSSLHLAIGYADALADYNPIIITISLITKTHLPLI
jgi:hypothetical protein